jgi:hypothetical protein
MGMPTGSNAPADVGVTVLAVRPHPDDESLATGGLLALYSTRGVRTGVVTCIRGEEGEIHHADLDPESDKARLRDIREQGRPHRGRDRKGRSILIPGDGSTATAVAQGDR